MKKIVILLISITFFNCAEKEEVIYTEITVDISNKTVSPGEEFTIKAISGIPVEYQSENDYHATVSLDQWGNGLVKSGYVGKTTINISNNENSKEVEVSISPKVTLYPTPILNFKASKEEIITILGTPDFETETTIKYNNYSRTSPFITYTFNNNKLLKSVTVTITSSYYSRLVNNHLKERYRLAGVFNNATVGNGLIYYNSLKGVTPTIVIYTYSIDIDNNAVVYIPYSDATEETSKKF